MLDRPTRANADPLADLIALADARCVFSAVFTADADWSIAFSDIPAGFKLGVVLDGHCWLGLGGDAPRRLERGDCYLLTGRQPYVLASDPALEPVPFDGRLSRGPGGDVRIAGGRFDLGRTASLLLPALPAVLVSPAGSEMAAVSPWVLARLREELDGDRVGGGAVAEHLSSIVFVQLLRTSVAASPSPAGWLGALADGEIGGAIRSMHAEPARRWTVGELGSSVGLSRSAFALRFTALVGTAPLSYLLRWRMLLAERSLRGTNATIAAIAAESGYRSESAFSAAFKRVTGIAPARYRAARR